MKEIITVLGIDPGFGNCGMFAIRFNTLTGEIKPGPHGMIKTSNTHPDHERIGYLMSSAIQFKIKVKPDAVGIEKFQFNRQRKKTFAEGEKCRSCGQELGLATKESFQGLDPIIQHSLQAVGVVMGIFAGDRLEMYQPRSMKIAVTGRATAGKEGKKEVKEAVMRILKMDNLTPEHLSDAAGHALKRLYMMPEYLQTINNLKLGPLFEAGQ